MQRISPLGWVAILSAALFLLMFALILLGVENPLRNVHSSDLKVR